MTVEPARPTILIVTSSTGGGHVNMAAALSEMLDDACTVVMAHPHPQIVGSFYSYASRYAVNSWSKVMRAVDSEVGARRMHAVLHPLTRNRLARIITEAAPDLIISTHSMLSYEVTQTVRAMRMRIPVVFQITDLALHRMWVTETAADAYLASTREIYDGLLAAGIDKRLIAMTGRPVRQQFLVPYTSERRATLAQLGLDPGQFTAFVQGGAEGSAGIVNTIESLLGASPTIQCVVAAGHSARLMRQFANDERVAALPYTQTIAPYMAACDVVIGKPGAGSVCESIMLEKPFIASTLIPYQETPNVEFIERYGLGWSCLTSRELAHLILTLMQQPELMTERVKNIQRYKSFNLTALGTLRPVISHLLERAAPE